MRSNLFLLLQSMTASERTDCVQYLRQPSLKVAVYLQQLYGACQAAVEVGSVTQMQDKAYIWAQAFPEKTFNLATYHVYTSSLCGCIKQFLAVQCVQHDALLLRRYELEALRKRGLNKLIDDLPTTKLQTTTAKQQSANYTTHWEIVDSMDRHTEMLRKRNPQTEEKISEASKWLDAHYILHKLRYACNAHSHTAILDTKIEVSASHLITELLAEHPDFLTEHPLIYCYYTLAEIQPKNTDAAAVAAFWQNLCKYEKLLGSDDLDNIYSLLLNYCIQQNNRQMLGFNALSYHIYAHCFEYGYWAEIKDNVSAHYKNTIKLGLNCAENQTDIWQIQVFADKHSSSVEPDMVAYSKALIAFYNTDYAGAIALLSTINFDETQNQFDVYCLQLRACYLSQQSEYQYSAENFRKALERQKSKQKNPYEAYKNFLSLMNSLYTYRNKNKKGSRELMLNKITERENSEQPTILNSVWLLAEINKLP